MKVCVIGASNKPERYSYKAIKLLEEHNHEVLPVHPKLKDIEGIKVYPDISSFESSVHTVTMYVGAARSTGMQDDLIKLAPQRVIFNPGAENALLMEALKNKGIEVMEACTLVMLHTGQF